MFKNRGAIMKSFKILSLLTVVMAGVAMIACDAKNMAEQTRTVMEKNLAIMEEFIDSVEETQDSQVYLSALQKMKADMERLIPEMNELDKKYPELFKLGVNKEPSPELQKIMKELLVKEQEIRPKFVAALQKVMTDANDPEIKEELQKIFELQKRLIK